MSWYGAAAESVSRRCVRAAVRAAPSSSRSDQRLIAERVPDELGVAGVASRVVDVVHCRHSVVLGVGFLSGGWWGRLRKGQHQVGKDLQPRLADRVGARRLRGPRMHDDRVSQLIPGRAIWIADFEPRGTGPIGALWSP